MFPIIWNFLLATLVALAALLSVPADAHAQGQECNGVCWHNTNYTQYSCASPDLDPDDYPGWSPSTTGCTGTLAGGIACAGTSCINPEEEDAEDFEQMLADGSVLGVSSLAVAFVSHARLGDSIHPRQGVHLEVSPCWRVIVARYYAPAVARAVKQAAETLTI